MSADILTHPAARLPADHDEAGQAWLPPLWLWPESPYRGCWEYQHEPEYLIATGRAASIGKAAVMLTMTSRRCPRCYCSVLINNCSGNCPGGGVRQMNRQLQFLCRSCGCALARREVREIVVPEFGTHGPFCATCAQSAKGMSFAEWLDDQWQRQRPH